MVTYNIEHEPNEQVVTATALQLCMVWAFLVMPSMSAGMKHVHFHHWHTGLLGACAFNFQRRFGMAAQVSSKWLTNASITQ